MRIFGATTASGSGGTVTTDGVTIQGNGSGGSPIALLDAITDGVTLQGAGISSNKLALKAVQTDATLTGAGTVASKLSVVSTPLTYFPLPASDQVFTVPQNQTEYFGFVLPYPLTFSKIAFKVTTGDGGSTSDVGIYTAAGVLVADIGAQALNTTAFLTIATVQGLLTIQPGLYLFAATSASNTLVLAGGFDYASWVATATGGVTAGGALLASVTAPSRSVVASSYQFALTI